MIENLSLYKKLISLNEWEKLPWNTDESRAMKEWEKLRPDIDDENVYYLWAIPMYCPQLLAEFEDRERVLNEFVKYATRSRKWFRTFVVLDRLIGKKRGVSFLEEMRERVIEYYKTPFEDRHYRTPLTRAQRNGVLKWE